MDHEVLVVEDEPDLNELVGAYVQIAGYGYRRALTGKAAVQEARAVPCALIVLDIMLPDMDGFQVCRSLKADPATAHVPIIFLTAMDNLESRQRGTECGAVAYLCKPFDPDLLMEAVRRHAH